jgi:hypothetical protein
VRKMLLIKSDKENDIKASLSLTKVDINNIANASVASLNKGMNGKKSETSPSLSLSLSAVKGAI